MTKRYIGWEDLHESRNSIITHMLRDQWCPQLVVGLSRGGLPLATMLSHSLDVPMAVITLSLRDHIDENLDLGNFQHVVKQLQSGRRVLVVDDINDTGNTLSKLSGMIQKSLGVSSAPLNLRYATMLNKESSQFHVDYTWQQIQPDHDHVWWVFPWENH